MRQTVLRQLSTEVDERLDAFVGDVPQTVFVYAEVLGDRAWSGAMHDHKAVCPVIV
jgi:hypothetical protein